VSYAAFAWEDYTVDAHEVPVDGTFEFGLTVRNTGEVAGSEVVRLYLHDPYAQTTRPWAWLVYAKVSLDPGEAERIRFIVSADLAAFTGREGTRIVEPGDIELWLATAASPVAPPPRAARAHRRDPRAQPLRRRRQRL
jgi:beta-xylosidase